MEKESFEDSEVASLLNEKYISIKVDREERPDVDSIYMQVCHMITGSGGWPLSIIMDYARAPFFAGTYFPKNGFGRNMGFIDILEEVSNQWKNGRASISDAQSMIKTAISASENNIGGEVSAKPPRKAVRALLSVYDPEFGGFGSAPKFPSPHNIMLLLRAFNEYGDENAKQAALKTLDSMASGGIRDHIGGGFCRYSTDRLWLAPHFEKMLYDNALLALAYAEAFLVSGETKYKNTAQEILDYVIRDMTDADGGFYSAEDADSEGVEGKFYVWKKAEVLEILGNKNGERFCELYDITEGGNFESANIPNLIKKTLSASEAQFAKNCGKILFHVREKRIHPQKDTKILASWNGLMIAAFAYAGRIFGDKKYVSAAEKAVQFVFSNLVSGDKLYTRYRDGEILKKSFADGYAAITWGLIELYEAVFKPEYLEKAMFLTEALLKEFYDSESSGVFLYPKSEENILTRPKEIYDGASPSANSITAYNLIRLSRLTGNASFERTSRDILNYFASEIEKHPHGYSFAQISIMYLYGNSCELVLSAADNASAEEPLSLLNGKFLPFTTALLLTPQTRMENISNLAPFTETYPLETDTGALAAYLCRSNACLPPIRDLEILKKEL